MFLTVIKFDNIDFISGFMTYMSWVSDHPIFETVLSQSKSHQLNIEYQLPIVTQRNNIKQVISELVIPDISNIVWEYFAAQCHYQTGIITCITEFEMFDDIQTSIDSALSIQVFEAHSREYWVNEYYRCECHRYGANIEKPFLCKVTIV
jgi:hypothetical protein